MIDGGDPDVRLLPDCARRTEIAVPLAASAPFMTTKLETTSGRPRGKLALRGG